MFYFMILALGLLMMSGCASQATFGDAITEGEPTPIPTPIVPQKPVYQVERGSIVYERRFYGRIAPVVTAEIGFQIDGQVLETYAAAGDEVTEGDVLARLHTSAWEDELFSAEEDLAIAQSIFDSAEGQMRFASRRAQLNFEMAQLRLDYAIAQAADSPDGEFDISLRRIERDLAQVAIDELTEGVDPQLRFDAARAQKRVDEVKEIIAKADLRAPMTGRVIFFSPDPGEPMTAFEAVAVVADMSLLEITDEMNADDLAELAEGMPVAIQRVSLPDEVYAGAIAILPAPYGLGADPLVHVAFETQPPPDAFKVGDRMAYTVVVEERHDALWLPSSAIRQFSGRDFVVVQHEGIQRRVDVRLGLEGGERVEILEGLEENQTVIGP